MNPLLLSFILVIVFTAILKLILTWSYNIIFAVMGHPLTWAVFCVGLGFLWFGFAGGMLGLSISVTWWSALIALFLNIPPKRPKQVSDAEFHRLAEDLARDADVAYNPAKYRLGLAGFAVGAIVGWITFYGSVAHV